MVGLLVEDRDDVGGVGADGANVEVTDFCSLLERDCILGYGRLGTDREVSTVRDFRLSPVLEEAVGSELDLALPVGAAELVLTRAVSDIWRPSASRIIDRGRSLNSSGGGWLSFSLGGDNGERLISLMFDIIVSAVT